MNVVCISDEDVRNIGSSMTVEDEYIERFAKPEEIGLTTKRFKNSTLAPREMSFDNVYPVPAGTFDIQPVKNDKVPLDKRVTGTFSEGTLVQLLSRGPQDTYLTYNPQMSFFKQVYKRYTNFAVQQIEEKFSTTVRFGTKNTCTLSKNGDLVGTMCLRIKLPDLGLPGGTWKETMGYNVMSDVTLRIGDTVVQRHPSLWMDMEDKLFCPSEKYEGLSKIVKRDEVLSANVNHQLIVPLKFFCCYRTSSKQQYIPILNLNTNINVYLDFNLKPLNILVNVPAGAELPDVPPLDAGVLVDYVYLDDTERYRFAQNPSTYTIEQLSIMDANTYLTTTNGQVVNTDKVYIPLRQLNKPVKYVAIVSQLENDFTSFTYYDIVQKSTFYLNSDEQFEPRTGDYFKLVQTYQHFTRSNDVDNILVFSFALDAASFQPCGMLNFAPYVRTQFAFDITPQTIPKKIRIFAVCINWVDFDSGMCKLQFN